MVNHPNLIVIYGAPASGKLTIASELALVSELTLFPNHVTKRLVSQFLPPSSPSYFQIIDHLRIQLIVAMLKLPKSVVFTFAPSGSQGDLAFLQRLEAHGVSSGAFVLFVHLTCKKETLLRRVENTDRKMVGKLSDKNLLKEALGRYDYYAEIKVSNIVEIDTDVTTPEQAVLTIIESLGRR
jgi:deoxyadenosine/deoxycytidine kinase